MRMYTSRLDLQMELVSVEEAIGFLAA